MKEDFEKLNPDSGEEELSEEKISVPEFFTYRYFQENPGKISSLPYLKEVYEAQCKNGKIQIYTVMTKAYWIASKELNHMVPDWKLHLSISPKHLPKAWDILVGIYLKMYCQSGMETTILADETEGPHGKQISISLFKYSPEFQQNFIAKNYYVTRAMEQSEDYWIQMIKEIELLFDAFHFEPNGLAEGDLAIGKYISLRNEAYIMNSDGIPEYPANHLGWNASNQLCPLNIQKVKAALKENSTEQEQSNSLCKYLKFAPLLLLAATFFLKDHAPKILKVIK